MASGRRNVHRFQRPAARRTKEHEQNSAAFGQGRSHSLTCGSTLSGDISLGAAMSKFEVIRLPLMTQEGTWVAVPPEQWKTILDTRGLLKLQNKSMSHVLSFGNLLAIEIGDEQQVANIGKTMGRMALTGVGAALFSQGRQGGVGAGLLDLSIRGAEQKSVLSGLMIFFDSSVVKFKLSAQEFDAVVKSVPQAVFSTEALQNASEMFDLLRRMKADGERVLNEIVASLMEAKSEMHMLLSTSEAGTSFADRDAARQELVISEHKFQRERFLFTALLYDLGISPQQFFAKNSYPKEISELVPSAGADEEVLESIRIKEEQEKKEKYDLYRGIAFAVVIALWALHHFNFF